MPNGSFDNRGRRDEVRKQVVANFCHRVCRECLDRDKSVAWAAAGLTQWTSQEERLQIERAGAVLLEGVTGDKDLMTNSVGIAAAANQTLGGDRAERLVRSSYLGTAPEWQHLAAVENHETEEGENEAAAEEDAEGMDPGQAGAGVGEFPPDDEPGLLGEARREKEIARLVGKLHLNLGHLSKDRMMVMLKAGAREDVLDYLKKRFECDMCGRRQREMKRRVAAYPRTYMFNKIVAVDVLYVPWRGRALPALNVVDHGSHCQVVTLVKEAGGKHHRGGPPSSEEAWQTFKEAWVRPFGAPEVVISDAGSEFQRDFAAGLELQSTFHHVVDADSPWQNGVLRCRAPRRGDQEKTASRVGGGPGSSQTRRRLTSCSTTSRLARTCGTPGQRTPRPSWCSAGTHELRRSFSPTWSQAHPDDRPWPATPRTSRAVREPTCKAASYGSGPGS